MHTGAPASYSSWVMYRPSSRADSSLQNWDRPWMLSVSSTATESWLRSQQGMISSRHTRPSSVSRKSRQSPSYSVYSGQLSSGTVADQFKPRLFCLSESPLPLK